MLRRLELPAQESVEDRAQLEQIAQAAEGVPVAEIVVALRCVGAGIAPVGPCGWNERAAAVRQDNKNEQYAASLDAADHRQRLAFEGMAPARDGYLIRIIAEAGSVSPLPLIRFRIRCFSSKWLGVWWIATSCA